MLIYGIIALAAAGFCGYKMYDARTQIQRMTITETYQAADVLNLHQATVSAGAQGAFKQMLEVKGVVRTGPGGPLKSQMTETECVWHRHKIERKYKERYRDKDGNRRTRTKEETLSVHRTEDSFWVEDQTGRVLVLPTVIVDKPKKVRDEFREPEVERREAGEGFMGVVGDLAASLRTNSNDTIGYRHREWVLKDGARVYVLGEASDADGELAVRAPDDGSKLMISTQSEEQLSDQHGKMGVIYTVGVGAGTIIGLGLVIASFFQ